MIRTITRNFNLSERFEYELAIKLNGRIFLHGAGKYDCTCFEAGIKEYESGYSCYLHNPTYSFVQLFDIDGVTAEIEYDINENLLDDICNNIYELHKRYETSDDEATKLIAYEKIVDNLNMAKQLTSDLCG